MATVTVRDLARNTAAVIQDVASSGRPALVTRNGKPVAALVPIDQLALEDWLLAHSAEFTKAVAGADPDLAAGRDRSGEWQKARQGAPSAGNGGARAQVASPPEHLRGSHQDD
ncbi:MAG TPA: type II toxin-antitoxin system Phd/YefM family antitoxin [Candidatus Dormibacteraeota bacterium]